MPPDRPRVVIHDPIRSPDWSYATDAAIIERAGADLILPEDETAADRAIEDADVVIVSGIRRLGRADIERMRDPVGILCYSIGMDRVDGDAAAERGIPVRNVPGYCSDEVADHAMTLLLAAWRRLVPLSRKAASGDWSVDGDTDHAAIRRLRGSTLGIIGLGRIGGGVARRARAFGMHTIGYDPYVAAPDPEVRLMPLDDVLAAADGLVICAALTGETRGLIGDAALQQVRPGCILVNVARGAIVDERALLAALQDGRVAVAALDVRDPEPPDPASDGLAAHPNVLQTPHIAASSQEAVEDLHRMAAHICVDLLRDAGRLPRA